MINNEDLVLQNESIKKSDEFKKLQKKKWLIAAVSYLVFLDIHGLHNF